MKAPVWLDRLTRPVRLRRSAPVRASYMTPAGHQQEAERLAYVADDVMQSCARRSLGDVIALGRLHLDLATAASGDRDASRVRCVLCQHAPCNCPPFGSEQYFALLDQRHGRNGGTS